ncbi:dihydrolipoamide acetyltransferase family protein [Salinilacihabitans rarus]|uniref:dihydrolipoamide acetyltransferase family protein n=1 Tax=Salinilacihabitans rarus TaxID=2961596 RepID=UPI0020C93848|nr:dihydrolipoamide acetyltransferase family protein [Salinilacihabitans rarus]
MVREFKLPDVGEGVAEGELVSWLVEPGDAVSEDQPVAEVETDKALVEVPSPVDGTVRELRAEAGEMVPVGDVIVTFDVEGEEPAEAEPAESDERAGEPEAEEGGAEAGSEEVATPEGRVFAPPRVRRLAREEGVDLSTVEGSGPGGRITEGDVRAAAEGGASGTAAEADAGAADPASEAGDAGAAQAPASTETTAAPQVESADRDRTLAAPATRRIADEEGVDIDAVPAAEERDGEAFVTPEAVREYAEAQRRAQEADAAALAGREEPAERERREPFTGVRRTIAEAMERSKYTAPHVTHHDEVDVTKLVETRERLKPVAEERGIGLTYMPFIMKAAIAALKEFPQMNAMIDDENEEIVYKNYYNVGVATATDVGLMVPVVEDADRKGLLQLSSEMNELVQKARERSISPNELRGSTFTITNIGGIGGEYATPILNYPEAGILAVGEIKRKPRVVTDEDGNESIEPRSVMTLSLSFDHRLIDGAEGARFTNKVMEYLENPELLLLE